MPRYFFDMAEREADPDPLGPDSLGTDLADDAVAAHEAVMIAGAWLNDYPACVQGGGRLHVAVRDGTGRAVFSVRVEAVEPTRP